MKNLELFYGPDQILNKNLTQVEFRKPKTLLNLWFDSQEKKFYWICSFEKRLASLFVGNFQ